MLHCVLFKLNVFREGKWVEKKSLYNIGYVVLSLMKFRVVSLKYLKGLIILRGLKFGHGNTGIAIQLMNLMD